MIYSDRSTLLQIYLHIVSNAFKFTEKGFIYISLKMENENLVFTCQDTGEGMDDYFMDQRLFTPFSQENAELGSKPRGLGLGLSLSKNLIQKMGGKINIKSEKKIGTTVTISIPLQNYNESTPENQQTVFCSSTLVDLLRSHQPVDISMNSNHIEETHLLSNLSPTKQEIEFFKLCALVVDDNQLNRQVLTKLLLRNGFETLEAANGNEALDLIKQHKEGIHIILLVCFLKNEYINPIQFF